MVALVAIWSTSLKPCFHTNNLHKKVFRNDVHNHQNMKATKMSSVSEWINKFVQSNNVVLFGNINELSSCVKTWISLKGILLSERSQSAKDIYCMILTT